MRPRTHFMPTIRLTKNAVDALKATAKDIVYWDAGLPGFGIKVTPRGRKVCVALYRTGSAGSRLRKYTIGPYGRLTLQMARAEAQKIFAAGLKAGILRRRSRNRGAGSRPIGSRTSSRSSLSSMYQRPVR